MTEFLHSLHTNEWTLVESPDGAPQWEALSANATYPDAFIEGKFHRPTMLTSDLALIKDDIYFNISKTFLDDFDLLTEKFALAWCKYLNETNQNTAHLAGAMTTGLLIIPVSS